MHIMYKTNPTVLQTKHQNEDENVIVGSKRSVNILLHARGQKLATLTLISSIDDKT